MSYCFQGEGIYQEREKIIAPGGSTFKLEKTPGFSGRVRAFDREGMRSPENCTVTWRIRKQRANTPMKVRRANGPIETEFGLIHMEPGDSPLRLFDPQSEKLLDTIVFRPDQLPLQAIQPSSPL
ncbi:hypothetical protein ISS86_03325 [Candidatus Microgenomates bacterium]|nr:hypothetical protein [Candidatus Microgenomates bacterium]